MLVVTVTYKSDSGTKFDDGYYMGHHIPMVRRLWSPLGLTDVTVLRGTPGPDGAAPAFAIMALLSFPTMAEFKQASKQHGKEIFGDVPNFTDAQPTVQFNETLG